MAEYGALAWILFIVFVIGMLALDLGVFRKKTHTVSTKEALIWTGVWVSLALLFCAGVYYWKGPGQALEFLTGYLIEESLSVDNIFVFIVVFSYYKVPAEYQHKVLFWGILGALIMRAIFILVGISLINQFHWIIYVFGAFLIYTGFKLFNHDDEKIEPGENPVLRLSRKFIPMTPDYRGDKFMVKEGTRRFGTPLLAVLIVIETTDLVFALDSIPAILAVSRDPFIVYTSNVFAILGLRSLYFALSGIMGMFYYLNYGLAVILMFVGVKMVISDIYHIPILVSLAVVGGVLILSVVASIIRRNRLRSEGKPEEADNSPAEEENLNK